MVVLEVMKQGLVAIRAKFMVMEADLAAISQASRIPSEEVKDLKSMMRATMLHRQAGR